MFNLFKEKCPVCKMALKEGKDYPEFNGKKFCSEDCKKTYKEEMENPKAGKSSGCCH